MPRLISRLDVSLSGSLVGAQLERADLRKKYLRGADFSNANLRGADLTDADLRGCKFVRADLSRACLLRADCTGADFTGADLSAAYMKAVNFTSARLVCAILKRVCAKNAIFFDADLSYADVLCGDFLGARFNRANTGGIRNLNRAIFYWYTPDGGGKPTYDPRPGYIRMATSVLGGVSFQENAAKQPAEKHEDGLDDEATDEA